MKLIQALFVAVLAIFAFNGCANAFLTNVYSKIGLGGQSIPELSSSAAVIDAANKSDAFIDKLTPAQVETVRQTLKKSVEGSVDNRKEQEAVLALSKVELKKSGAGEVVKNLNNLFGEILAKVPAGGDSGDSANPGDGSGDSANPGDGSGDSADPGDGSGSGGPGDGSGSGGPGGDSGDSADPGGGSGDSSDLEDMFKDPAKLLSKLFGNDPESIKKQIKGLLESAKELNRYGESLAKIGTPPSVTKAEAGDLATKALISGVVSTMVAIHPKVDEDLDKAISDLASFLADYTQPSPYKDGSIPLPEPDGENPTTKQRLIAFMGDKPALVNVIGTNLNLDALAKLASGEGNS